jgi:nicotinamide-nucleotide amidase
MGHPDVGQPGAEALSRTLVETLSARGLTLAVAESVTGGLVAASLTSVPGASACLRGGFVAYCDQAKERILGVPGEVIERHTAVSAEVALLMAHSARRALDADLAVATTGEAGPSSGSGRPIGTVFVATCDRHQAEVTSLHLCGDRSQVRRDAVEHSLSLVLARTLG